MIDSERVLLVLSTGGQMAALPLQKRGQNRSDGAARSAARDAVVS